MAFELSWITNQRVIYLKVTGTLTLAENNQMNTELTNYIESGQSPVHLIVELSDDANVPMDVSLLAKSPIRHEKMGHAALVGGNNVLRFMAKIVSQLTKAKAHMVDSKDEAIAKLREFDPSIN